jgi:hypothetical protein
VCVPEFQMISYLHFDKLNTELFFVSHPNHIDHLSSDLGLDKSQSLGTVLVNILLVSVGIVSIAAVRVGSVAVALDDAGGSWRAREARRTSGKALVGACANVVWQAGAVVGIAHENSSLDGCEGFASEGCARAAAEGVVHDLATLFQKLASIF